MQHGRNTRTLGRDTDQRTALIRGLALSLIRDKKISTTTAKAKELRPFVEKLITRAKVDSVANRRLVASTLGEPTPATIKTLFVDIAPTFANRPGGYTRITKLGRTKAGRDEAVIEFVE